MSSCHTRLAIFKHSKQRILNNKSYSSVHEQYSRKYDGGSSACDHCPDASSRVQDSQFQRCTALGIKLSYVCFLPAHTQPSTTAQSYNTRASTVTLLQISGIGVVSNELTAMLWMADHNFTTVCHRYFPVLHRYQITLNSKRTTCQGLPCNTNLS